MGGESGGREFRNRGSGKRNATLVSPSLLLNRRRNIVFACQNDPRLISALASEVRGNVRIVSGEASDDSRNKPIGLKAAARKLVYETQGEIHHLLGLLLANFFLGKICLKFLV
jgi:hypothetical protein